MVRVKDTFEPNPETVAFYEKMYPIYSGITKYTDEVLKSSYDLFN